MSGNVDFQVDSCSGAWLSTEGKGDCRVRANSVCEGKWGNTIEGLRIQDNFHHHAVGQVLNSLELGTLRCGGKKTKQNNHSFLLPCNPTSRNLSEETPKVCTKIYSI